nr:structure specific endonuclease subunit SLX4 [Hymenolepis microstoma]
MSLNDDQKDNITKCKLCVQSFDAWSGERIRLHLESCSERKARLLTQCPSCSKALSKATALKHAKSCADFLNISLFGLLFLNGDIPPGTLSNSKSSRSSKFPNSKSEPNLKVAKKTSKRKAFANTTNNIDHLLISSADRRKIFVNRLSDILHKEHFAWYIFENINSPSRYSSSLWDLSSLSPENKSERFYVDSLTNLVTPRKTKTHDYLRMSQIPGRSPSSLKQIHLTQTPEPAKQPTTSEYKNLTNESLSKMVASPLCSDLSICLDSGESIPAHRFILASWSSELALLTDNADSLSAPGLSKRELLNLLRALYTFDLSYFSALSPEAEFTLDCWQLLDIVRGKVKSDATSRLPITPKVQEPISVPDSVFYKSGVDLFVSDLAENTDLCSPRISLNSKTISPSSMSAIKVGMNSTDKSSVQSPVNTACHSTLPPTPELFQPNMILSCQSTPFVPLTLKTAPTPDKPPAFREPATKGEVELVVESADTSSLILETSSKNIVEAVVEQVDIEAKRSPQPLEHSAGANVEIIIEQLEESPLPGSAIGLVLEKGGKELGDLMIVAPSSFNNSMELDIQNADDKLGKSSCTMGNEINAGSIDNTPEEPRLLLASSPRNGYDKPLTQSPCHSVDLDPPSFGGGFDEFVTFETAERHVDLSAQKRSSKHLDLEDEGASSPTLVEFESAPPAFSNDSIFFSDDSAPTPAPLAKRLRASLETAKEADAIFSLSSQPILDHCSDKENSNNEDENENDLHASFSLSQPAPCTPMANESRVTSMILTDVPITPKPVFEAMPTPELRKALSEYGIRRLPKKKAVKLLNHIYDELHPYVEVPTVIEDNAPPEEDHDNGENSPSTSVAPRHTSAQSALEGISNSDSELRGPASTQNIFEVVSTSENETFSSSQQVPSGKIKLTPEAKNDILKARIWECLRNDNQLYYNIVTYVPLELDCVKAMLRDAGISVGLRRLSDLLDDWGVTFTTRNRHTAKPGMDTSDPTSANYLW